MSPLPGPGVFATSASNATPALLPDGTIAPGSVSELVEFSESERVARSYRSGTILTAIETTEHPHRIDAPVTGSSAPDHSDGPPADGGERR
ncbi:MAG TPA: hypothetical protein VHN80_00005, partial [Kineosporiaceae bacterium]|nr:hypothetical protein [Kineosporiaceae bacterium]